MALEALLCICHGQIKQVVITRSNRRLDLAALSAAAGHPYAASGDQAPLHRVSSPNSQAEEHITRLSDVAENVLHGHMNYEQHTVAVGEREGEIAVGGASKVLFVMHANEISHALIGMESPSRPLIEGDGQEANVSA